MVAIIGIDKAGGGKNGSRNTISIPSITFSFIPIGNGRGAMAVVVLVVGEVVAYQRHHHHNRHRFAYSAYSDCSYR